MREEKISSNKFNSKETIDQQDLPAKLTRRRNLRLLRSSSKVQEALKETSGTVDKPLTKAPRRAGKTSAPSSSKESSPSVGKKESSSVKSSSNNESSSKSSSSSKKIVSPHDLTEAIEMDIRKKTRESLATAKKPSCSGLNTLRHSSPSVPRV